MIGAKRISDEDMMIERQASTILKQQAEIERLRELVEEAYTEGYNDRSDREMFPDPDWYTSIARRYLQPEETIG